MTPVIHCSAGNMSLVPGMSFIPRKEIQLTRCSYSGKCTKVTPCSQRLLLPQSSLKVFKIYRRTYSLKHRTQIQVTATVGADVAVEEPNPAVSEDDAGETPEAPENSAGTSDPAPSNPAITSATTSKRPRPGRKSDMPPLKNEELVTGATFTGKVRSIQPFGAFVDFGAFTDGLVHVSRMSDGYVKDVGAVVSVGQEVKVRIVEVNMETGRISLSMRDSDDPSKPQKKEASISGTDDKPRPGRKTTARSNQRRDGAQKTSKFVKGQVLNGTVKNLTRSGAFISLPDGEEGFLPVSEESEGFGNVMGNSSLQPGQEVNVRVLRITRGQVTLTMKKEEDVEGLNKQLNKGVFHVATNPFELAFRQNKDIAAFLDERESSKISSESLYVSEAAKQMEIVERPATAVDDEQSGVPTASDVGAKAEQSAGKEPSDEDTIVGSLATELEKEPQSSTEDADAVPEAVPEVESSSSFAGIEAEQSADEEPSEEDIVVGSLSTELDKEPESSTQNADAVPETVLQEESSSTVAGIEAAKQSADEKPSEEDAAIDSSVATKPLEEMSSPKGSVPEQNEVSADDSPANLHTDDASTFDGAKEPGDNNKIAAQMEGTSVSESSPIDKISLTSDITITAGSDSANEIAQRAEVSNESLSEETGSSTVEVHAENLPLEGNAPQEIFTTQSAVTSVDDKSETEAPQLVENEMASLAVKGLSLEAPDASNGQTGIQESTVKATISPLLVKQLRQETGAGMMDCKKALAETGGDVVKAQEFLRKKGLASADKKASRATAEGRIGSYIHDNRIGVLIEVNCETDFVSRGEIFKELVDDLAMQVAACPQVRYLVTEDVPEEIVNKEREIEMQKEDLLKKPEEIRSKIVDGRIRKRLEELALLEQPYIKNDKMVVKDLVKQTIATIGENIKVKRFVRYNLGEGLEKKSQDFAAEVAAQTAAKFSPPAAPKDKPAETKEAVEKLPAVMVSAALVKKLREETGAGMMDCKKALTETGGDLEKAQEYLRKKGLSSADKKSSRLAAEGCISSYIHDSRIGTLIEVNCETDFVGRSEKFKELVDELAMQVVACPQVEFISVDEISESFIKKEKEIEMQREDLKSKPENIREKIVEGRISKRLGELALLEQPFIKDDSILVKDLVKQTGAAVGENIKVRRFVRYTLGENKD